MSVRTVARLAATTGLLAGSVLAAPTAAPAAQPTGYDASVRAVATSALTGAGVDRATATAVLAAATEHGIRGERIVRQLGVRDAGFWIDLDTGELVVNVLDEPSAAVVRAAGARPNKVERSAATLRGIVRELDRLGGPAGTAWGVDDSTNQVVVMISDGAGRTGLDGLRAAAARRGGAVRVEHVPGKFSLDLQGGEPIYDSARRGPCSAGFNVIPGYPPQPPPSGGNRVLTAGHCTSGAPTWRVGSFTGPYFGPTIGSSFPGNDYGIIRKDGTEPTPRTINLYNGSSQTITSGGDPYRNRPMCKSGWRTRLTCGTVTATNVTVNYAEGTVTGMARSNACSGGGDSGGPWFQGPTAIALHSGGNGLCPNAVTFGQPVGEAMRAYNVFFPNA